MGSCYDAQTRVVYVVTSACNLYGIHIGKDSGGGDASRPFLRMSLLVGGGGDGALADEEPALPARSVVVGVEYIAELRGVCIAAASGELILVAPDPDDDHATTTARGAATVGEAGAKIPAGAVGPECIPECVGAVPSGIRAMRWNPDGEILLVATGDGQLVCMNKDFFVLAEAPLGASGERVGTAAASLSWRGDGAYAASLTLEVGDAEPRLRVWSREDLEPHSEGEVSPASPLESGVAYVSSSSPDEAGGGVESPSISAAESSAPPLAWQPRGALVAAASARGGVVFFERNGLRRGGFDLPRDGAGDRVRALAWSSDSSALCVTTAGDSAHGVQVWTRGNMRWYLKREMRYPRVSSGGFQRAPLVRWDEDDADVLRVFTADGTVEEHAFGWDVCVSAAATAAVVDGCRALITPLARTPIPPPMCAATAIFSAPVSELAWVPGGGAEGGEEAGETLLALLADGTLEIVSSTRGTEWEETCEELARELASAKGGDGDDGDDEFCLTARPVRIVEDDTVASFSDASFSDWGGGRTILRRLRHLACPSPRVAVMTADCPRDGSAALLVVDMRRDEIATCGADRDEGWSGAMTRACVLPGEATRVTPLEGGAPATVLVQVRGQSTPMMWTEGDGGGCFPARLPEVALRESCAVARAFTTADSRALLVGLDAGGTLRCGSRAVALGVRSFAVHRCAGDGTVAAGSDAPDVSYAVSLSRRSVPRVTYVTLADELRVAEVADLLGLGDSSGPGAGTADAEAPINRDELASAAGGKRGGGNSRSVERGGVYMDQLHVSMRAAMRPADWARAADFRTRRVEEGSRIVAAPPGSVNVVLQMPRGNLETVHPRSLALPAVTAALAAGRFTAAATLAARHRVDLNLLVDYAWPSFLSRASEFVESVNDPDVVMELIEVLDPADTTAPGGVYAHLRGPDVDAGPQPATGEKLVGKVAGTCSAIRAAVEARSYGSAVDRLLDDRWELVVLSAHARTEPPDLGAALARVGRRRELELAAVSGGGGLEVLDSKKVLDSATALKHLIALVGGEALYEAALGTYDLSLAYLVGTHSAMDPGEFVADLKRLQDIESEPLRRADVDARLGRWPSCVENLLRGGDVAGACEVAERRRLFPHALAALSESLAAEGSASSKECAIEVRREVTRAYAAFLSRERRHEDAAVALLSVGEGRAALDEYREAVAWRPALALAARLGLSQNERTSIAEEICEALELTDPSSAAIVAAQHLGDVDRAVGSLTRAREWRESARVAYLHNRADLVETVVAPCAAEAAQGVLSEATELPSRLDKYLTRLRDLRTRREAMRRAIDAGAEAWRGDRPGGGDDDDAASEAPSLASGVSGMSAYTDRTAGARTATSHARSGVPSTQGGRKPTRKQRRGKKAGAGLRAGGPTEERDLAAHLASGAVAGSLGAPRALEEIGELTELLVSLGHAEDAAALQRAVSDAVAALESAREEARLRGEALNREEAAAAAADAEEVVVDATKVSVGAHAASKEVQTAAAQWKWAALRGSNAR